MSENRFCVDYGKRQAGCKKCKKKIEKGEVRIAKITANPFNDEGDMKNYHHPACIFETFAKARATTKIVEDPGDLEGWAEINQPDKDIILALLRENNALRSEKKTTPKKATPAKASKLESSKKKSTEKADKQKSKSPEIVNGKPDSKPVPRPLTGEPQHPDSSFKQFQRICIKMSDNPSYLKKTEILDNFFRKGTGTEFKGDLYLWVKLLIPGVVKRIYNMQNKQLIKIFSRIFGSDEDAMLTDLEQGDVAQTIASFYAKSRLVTPVEKGGLQLDEVDGFLEELSQLSKEEQQQRVLYKIVKRTSVDDLRMFVRLLKGDLKIGSGAKHVLDALHPDAHDSFNSSRNLEAVIEKILELRKTGNSRGKLDIGAIIMQPVQPMLAAPCRSIDIAFKKCPNGIYSEIKYDGERVQVHKKGTEFKYFSRSLKPVMAHKVKHFKDYIPKAFPKAADLILDTEVLLVDNKTGKPLPFGSLGVHKGSDFKDADPCLFVFDCLLYNGENLMNKPIKERRKFLVDNMVEVGNRIKLSEIKHITKKQQLVDMIKEVLSLGLEGLMIKDTKSIYEPGKRHWMKIKKDYLNEGAMADSADLVVLGGWYGSGQKGGLISIFLMGCKDPDTGIWYTVSKVHTGNDDATLERLQGELLPKMSKIKGDFNRVPAWLKITRNMVPDFIVRDPQDSPVWEITGAEFSKADLHTAAGISIRFPRVTRIRDDKNPDTATNLNELKELYKTSKQHLDVDLGLDENEDSKDSNNRKRKNSDTEQEPSTSKKIKSEEETKKAVKDRNYSKNPEFSLTMKSGDLFSSPPSSSLAHCISRDCRLGKGIAKIFRNKFGRVNEIEACRATVGDIAVLKEGTRYIYNLVTKEKYSGKPTYQTLKQSLEKMKDHAIRKGVREISLPKIGCGLDGLQWPAVKTLIKNVFQSTDIQLTMYLLGDDNDNQGETKKSQTESKQTSVKDFFSKNSTPIKKKETIESDDSEAKVAVGFGYSTSHPLPDVLTGLKIYLSKAVPDYEALWRGVKGLGGECIDTPKGVTHRVYAKGEPLQNDEACKHVGYKWLRDSIKIQKVQPEKYYKL